jgi:hypothetical protein
VEDDDGGVRATADTLSRFMTTPRRHDDGGGPHGQRASWRATGPVGSLDRVAKHRIRLTYCVP